MTVKEIFTAVIIHLLVPLAGLIYFIVLTRRMKTRNVVNPPTLELLIVFGTYGGLLILTLTTLFWQWSGMASLGTFYLILGAPIAMGIIASRNKKLKHISKYHTGIYQSALLYFAIAPVIFLILFSISDK